MWSQLTELIQLLARPSFVCEHPLKEYDIFARVSVLMTFAQHFNSLDLSYRERA